MSSSHILGLLSLATLAAACGPAQPVSLPGHEVPLRDRAQFIGRLAAEAPMPITISLKPRDEAGLDALLADLYDPASPNFRHYLTPAQFAERFGATDAQVSQVVNFLESKEIHVTSIASNNLHLKAEGTVGAAERAFAMVENSYLLPDGRTAFANASAPKLPAEIASLITAIHGLDDTFRPHPYVHSHLKGPAVRPEASTCVGTPSLAADGYGPNDLREAYGVNAAGLTGAGETVGLVEYDGFAAADPACYFQGYGMATPDITVEPVDGGVPSPGGGEVEVDLDIEILGGIAPQSHILVYEEGQVSSDPSGTDVYTKIVTDNKVSVVSISWGGCEPDSGSAFLTAMDTILKQGATEGISFFAASGDSGAYDCANDGSANGNVLSADSPGSDPYVTAVGGTILAANADGSYNSETVWGDVSGTGFCGQATGNTAGVQTLGGGGGGYSMQWPKPSWQVGTGTTNASCPNPNGASGGRQVPDVSANAAAPDSEYLQGWGGAGGTSAAAPTWAGVMTLMNQYLKANGKPAVGYANPALYGIFNQAGQTGFHDVTVGDNLYYPATVGYDMGSGLGSPDAAGLAKALDPTGVIPAVGGGSSKKKGCDVSGVSPIDLGGLAGLLGLGMAAGMLLRRRFAA